MTKTAMIAMIVLVCTPWVLAADAATPAHAVQSENHVLHAVPPPGAVAIDGKLDDWDLTGQVECFADWRTREQRSAKVAAMYYKDCFYLAIAWRDPTPMHNMNDPQFEAGFGWRSDCVELRMITDLPLHVDCWYSAAAKRPMVVITYGSFNEGQANVSNLAGPPEPNAIDAGAKEAFLPGADGKSYTQEIALPWALITGQGAIVKNTGKPYAAPRSYQAGDTLSLMVELIWGGVDGRTSPSFRYFDLIKEGHTLRDLHPFTWERFSYMAEDLWGTVKLEPKGRLTLPQPDHAAKTDSHLQKTAGPIKLSYDMPFDGFATLVIEDENGIRVRNLIGMAPRGKGRQTDYWDCTDEGGSESAGKLVPPGKYRFRGLLHKGIAPVYEASYGTPGSPAWDTADGTGGWLSDFWPPRAVVAAKDTMVLGTDMTSNIGASIICTDLDGRKKWGDRTWWGVHSLAVDDRYVYVSIYRARYQRWWDDSAAPALGRLDLKTGKAVPFATQSGPQLKVSALKEGEKPGATKGIAVIGDRLALSMSDLNVVRFFDKQTASIVAELPVPKPGPLAGDAAGTLYVWSEDKLMKVIDGKLVPFISNTMKWPDGIAVDAAGQVFLADRATQQVKVYDKGGKLARVVGLAGGRRTVGTWQPDAMLNPAGLAVDSQGRLWVAEEDPAARRVSVWADDGRLVKDFMGPAVLRATADANADPDDKTRLFANGFEFRLDYDKNKAEPIAATRADTCGDWLKTEGRRYLMSMSGSLFFRNNDELKHVARIASFAARDCWAEPNPYTDGYPLPPFPEYHGSEGITISFIWTDMNNDEKPQTEEMLIASPITGHPQDWKYVVGATGCWLDEEFNLYGCATESTTGVGAAIGTFLTRTPLKGWTPGGVPIWDLGKQKLLAENKQVGILLVADGYLVGTLDNSFIGLRAHDGAGAVEPHKNSWPTTGTSNSVEVFDRDDVIICPFGCIGRAKTSVGTVFALNSKMGRLHLMTADGLFVASVFRDFRSGGDAWPNEARRGMPLDGLTMGDCWWGGHFFKAEKSNEYYLIAGTSAYNLIKLNGLESLRAVSGGAVTVTDKDFRAAQDLLPEPVAEKAADQ